MPPKRFQAFFLATALFFGGVFLGPISARASSPEAGATTYLGLYFKGSRIGYASYQSQDVVMNGKKLTKLTSASDLRADLLGSPTRLHSDSVTLTDAKGRPISMVLKQSSAGRTQRVVATFSTTTAEIKVNNSGAISRVKRSIPTDAPIVDDPLDGLVLSKAKPGERSKVYILDPTTVSFIANEIVFKGPKQILANGTQRTVEWVQIIDPRSNTDVYCTASGDLIRVDGPLGITMVPVSKALALQPVNTRTKVDLATGTRITPTGDLPSPDSLRNLQLLVTTSTPLAAVPSDEHQTVTMKPGTTDSWSIVVHPVLIPSAGGTIAAAAAAQPNWIKPDLNVPCDAVRFKKLAVSIVGGETDVLKATRKIQLYVYGKMKPDASIAVLRDANEVLDSCRGVCRDYAILAATLLRAAGIPTQVATGLVSWDGDFYYHAWVKVFDDNEWVGVDSTTDEAQISAAHIELASGSVSQAFTSPVLQDPTIKIVKAA